MEACPGEEFCLAWVDGRADFGGHGICSEFRFVVRRGRAVCEGGDGATAYPGVSVLVSRNGEIVRAEGFGFSNVELQVPVKPETLFQSGSVGKQFTATAVMMLVEEGKICAG